MEGTGRDRLGTQKDAEVADLRFDFHSRPDDHQDGECRAHGPHLEELRRHWRDLIEAQPIEGTVEQYRVWRLLVLDRRTYREGAAVFLAVLTSLALRRRQLGVLRALGASRLYVFSAVWIGITGMIALGAIVGLGLGWRVAVGLSTVLQARTGVALSPSLGWAELGMAAAVAASGAGAAAIPAWVAYRSPVSTALRR